MPRNWTWKRSIRLLTRGKNVPAKRRKTFPPLRQPKSLSTKLTGEDRYCPDCNTKYKVVTKETVKRLKFIPARFEVVEEVTFVYSCPKCGGHEAAEKKHRLF